MRLVLLPITLFIFFQAVAYAQSNAVVPLSNSQAYELISNLQNRGHLLNLNPERLPYTEKEIKQALEAMEQNNLGHLEKSWLQRLRKQFRFGEKAGINALQLEVMAGSALNNSKRKDVYRPLRENIYLWPFIHVRSRYQVQNIVLNTNLRFDFYYEHDPDGIDATNRLYTRNENTYLGFAGKYAKLYLGRFSNYWGLYNRSSALISDNPRTFDHLNFTVGSHNLSFQNIYGYLDSISGDDIFRGDTQFATDSKKRFVSLKRIDWRVSRNLLLTFKEGLIQSGLNANPEIKYLLPASLFVFMEGNTPYDDGLNLFSGGSIWFRINQFSLKSEIILDDIIFNRSDRGLTERSNFIWNADATYAFSKAPFDLKLRNELVTYQAYNTSQAEGRFLFLKRGLATQFNDYIFTELKLDWHAESMAPGLRLSPYYGLLLQGEQEINQAFKSAYPNGDPYEHVLTGTVERTNRVGAGFFYSPVSFFWVKADIGTNFTLNSGNREAVDEVRWTGQIEFGFRYNFTVNM